MACAQNDFEEGGVIYVRGQKAICKRTDEYPLIFWAYDDNPSVLYHRSLKDDADMFSITPPETDSKDNIESKDELVGAIESQADSKDAGSSEAAGSQPPKTTYENLEDDIVACDVVAPGAVHIEKCSQTTFTLDNKVSNITLVECKDVTVNFLSVISTCEVIRSVDCKILCKDKCTSFKIEDCQKINITFPKQDNPEEDEVKVVTTKCSEITLVAKADPYSGNEDIRYKVRRTSVSVSEKYQTSFNGKFETEEWTDDTRTSPNDSEENKASEEKINANVEKKKEENSKENSEEKNTEVSSEASVEKQSVDNPGGRNVTSSQALDVVTKDVVTKADNGGDGASNDLSNDVSNKQ